jgi:hypothetical protein
VIHASNVASFAGVSAWMSADSTKPAPLNARHLPNLHALLQVAATTVAVLLLTEPSAAVSPAPSLYEYAAT